MWRTSGSAWQHDSLIRGRDFSSATLRLVGHFLYNAIVCGSRMTAGFSRRCVSTFLRWSAAAGLTACAVFRRGFWPPCGSGVRAKLQALGPENEWSGRPWRGTAIAVGAAISSDQASGINPPGDAATMRSP